MKLGGIDDRPEVLELLARLKESLPALRKLLEACDQPFGLEDGVYRFYHMSYKTYGLQAFTTRIGDALSALAPGRQLHPYFLEIVAEGTGKSFTPEVNNHWRANVQPIVDAFFHSL